MNTLGIDLGQKGTRHTTKSSFIALDLAGNGDGREAVDLGCADGFWSDKLKSGNWIVKSIDKETSYNGAIEYNLNRGLPFPNSSLDLVFSTATIAYLDDTNLFVSEIKRVLKPDGRFIITTPNLGFWLSKFVNLKKMADQDQKHFFEINSIREIFPKSKIYGYFPYWLLKFRVSKLVDSLSPIFIIYGNKSDL